MLLLLLPSLCLCLRLCFCLVMRGELFVRALSRRKSLHIFVLFTMLLLANVTVASRAANNPPHVVRGWHSVV